MKLENNVIFAAPGKAIRRKSDGFIFGDKVSLGYTFFVNGQKLPTPRKEVMADFEEIDQPKTEEDKTLEVTDFV